MRNRSAVLLLVCAVMLLGAQVTRVRIPVGALGWYPPDAALLRAAVEQYLNDAPDPGVTGRLAACVVPVSGYPYCGAVAGHAFKAVQPGAYDRVVLLTGAHLASFDGCSIAAVQYHLTPLGLVPLDTVGIRRVAWSPFVTTRAVVYHTNPVLSGRRKVVHENEYGEDVMLPFLQVRLGSFELIPIVVGDMRDRNGRWSATTLDSVADGIRKVMDERTLLVVCTDFTHYGPRFGYTPFTDDEPRKAVEWLDRQAFHCLLNRDFEGFLEYLNETRNTICGAGPLAILLRLLPRKTEAALLDYRTSAEVTGDTENSVSYAAIVFSDPTQPPNEPRLPESPTHWEPVDIPGLDVEWDGIPDSRDHVEGALPPPRDPDRAPADPATPDSGRGGEDTPSEAAPR